uniref:Somatostatin/Cortistatin C-terminal domain-containing protein n=1 Tax=Neogobius melanostomus TaxID=47308 RepID=A0A8C6UQL2_9GOBI
QSSSSSAQMQCVLASVLLLSMLVLAESTELEESPEPMDLGQDLQQDLELTRHRLLQSAGLLFGDFAYLSHICTSFQLAEGHVILQRSEDSADRIRKPGCKNFYWKGFTSC